MGASNACKSAAGKVCCPLALRWGAVCEKMLGDLCRTDGFRGPYAVRGTECRVSESENVRFQPTWT
jgi:hypothetical protein